jgi:hypothetical protein
MPTNMIQRLVSPTRKFFFENVASQAQPAVIEGAMADWNCRKWTDTYLVEKLKNRRFQVNQTVDGRFGIRSMRPRPGETAITCTLGAFLKLIEAAPDESTGELREDVNFVPFLDASLVRSVNFWFSQRNSRIPLHWDSRDNILAQVRGSKSVKLYAPEQASNLYPGLEGEQWASQIDMDAFDLTQYPKFREAKVAAELTLEEGEMLYIPRRWWHHIITLSEMSLSINYWYDEHLPQASTAVDEQKAVRAAGPS